MVTELRFFPEVVFLCFPAEWRVKWNWISIYQIPPHCTTWDAFHWDKKKTSPCINCLARFCQCHFSFAHLAIFLFGPILLGQKSTVRRRLKSLEEEVQKLEEEQQLGLTLCLLIWMMWMLLPSWELASISLRPLWQFFWRWGFSELPKGGICQFPQEDQYFFSEYMIHTCFYAALFLFFVVGRITRITLIYIHSCNWHRIVVARFTSDFLNGWEIRTKWDDSGMNRIHPFAVNRLQEKSWEMKGEAYRHFHVFFHSLHFAVLLCTYFADYPRCSTLPYLFE